MSSTPGTRADVEPSPADSDKAPRLTFGIYPGGATSNEPGLTGGPADDPARILDAVVRLQGGARPFIVRGYVHYLGDGKLANQTPLAIERYAGEGRRIDLVLCYRDPAGDLEGWRESIRATVRRCGPALAALQVAEEPNNPNPAAGGDGASPHINQAIIAGILAAKEEVDLHRYDTKVGFNATVSFPRDPFWPRLGALITPAFLHALDYVGLDFFPDVFRPLSSIELDAAVAAVLHGFREVSHAAGNIPLSIPLHIGEHGWPTGPDRSYQRQSTVVETVIRTIHTHRAECNITHYEHHALRDADSSNPNLFCQFGLMRDDYTPKPAFETYRQLIAELGSA